MATIPTPPVQALMIEQEDALNQLHQPLAAALAATCRTYPSNAPVTPQAAKKLMKVADAELAKVYGPGPEQADLSPVGMVVQQTARQAALLQVQETLGFVRQQVGDAAYLVLQDLARKRREQRQAATRG